MTSSRQRKRVHRFMRPVSRQSDNIDTRKLGPLLLATMQPSETGEAWIDVEDVAARVSQRRKRTCSAQEVSAALRGRSIPALDIVSAALQLRAEQRRLSAHAAGIQKHYRHDEDLIRQALSSNRVLSRKLSLRGAPLVNSLKRRTAWAIGVLAAAVLTLLATGVLPNVLGQLFNGPALEDKFRSGAALLTNESIRYVDGPQVPVSIVMPGNYQPSSALVRDLSRPMGAASPAFLEQEHAGGVQPDTILIQLILEGNRNQSIRVLGIEPVQILRGPPLSGIYFEIGSQGVEDTNRVDFNLDQPSPQAHEIIGINQITNRLFFELHTILLNKGEQVVLLIQANTVCYDVKFALAINYLVGGIAQTLVIDNNGHPFQVTGYEKNFLSYRRIFALQGNFSVISLSRREIARTYQESPEQASCPP